MKLNPASAFLAGALCFTPAAAFAQKPATISAADQAWSALTSAGPTVSPGKSSAAPKTPAQAKDEQKQRSLGSRQTAQAAKDFYGRYPDHANAGAAKKLEAMASLRGVTDDDPAYEQSAVATAQAYRTDAKNPAGDRFDVAALTERLLLSRSLNRPLNDKNTAGLEKIAVGLHREFGELPHVYRFYSSVARSADMVTADRIAQSVMALPEAPSEVRAEAQGILERRNLLGRPLLFPLTSVEGQSVDLARRNDQPTVLYLWSAAMSPGSLAAPKAIQKSGAADCRWIYVAVDSTQAQVNASKHLVPFAGTQCVFPPGAAGPLLDYLKNRQFPCVYVISRSGLLTGYGPVEELPALLRNANR